VDPQYVASGANNSRPTSIAYPNGMRKLAPRSGNNPWDSGAGCRFHGPPFDKIVDNHSHPVLMESIMKFVCLGYADFKKMKEYSQQEISALMEECFAYDDELRRGGHFLGGEALQTPDRAATIRLRDGKVTVTDGPYAETKEQLGGILLLEARDFEHAVALMSKHPGVKFGPFEIRPANEEIHKLFAAHSKKAGA
jgi:hypothetical protein